MNYLELTKKLRQECGIPGIGPVSVVDQRGEAKRLADYINDAWLEIQGLHDHWNFMREQFSLPTTAGVGDYAPSVGGLDDFRQWHKETLRCQRADAGVGDEQWLVEWDYQTFRNTYRFAQQTPGRPVVFAVKPKGDELMLGSIPDAVYTITGEYQRVPTLLEGDDDVPDIPTHLHLVIVYKAMEFYGLFESAGEVLARSDRGYKRLMAALEREELPDVYLGNPLA